MPGRLTWFPAGSMTMNWFGQILPAPASTSLILMTYVFAASCTLSRMRTAGITKPISIASERRSALLFGQAVATVGAVDERQQGIAQLDLEIVDLQRSCDRLFRRGTCGSGGRGSSQRGGFGGRGGALALARRPRQHRRPPAQPAEGEHRNAPPQPQ